MKVLLVNPKARFTMEILTNPLGILSIATYLKAHSHTVRIYDNGVSKQSFKDVLKEYSPDIVGISVISGKAVDDAIALSKTVKAAGISVVWGGYLPSAMPELALKTGCVDMVSIGEGEYTWLELLNSLETGKSFKSVAGLAYMKDGEFIKTAEREFVDLAELPTLDFDLIDIEHYIYPYYYSKRTLSLYSSKGCTGHCTFCYNAAFNKSRHRVRPPEQVVAEISYLVEQYGIDGIHFNDDLIFCNKEEMYRFCSLLKAADLKLNWGSSCIIGLFGKEELRYMYDTGCRWLMFGVESGSKEMLKCVKKGINYEKIEQTCSDCADIGIIARAGFIVGFPGESENSLRETVSLALRLKTSQISINYYTVVPASESYEQMIREGKISRPDNLQSFIGVYSFDKLKNFSNVPDKDLKTIYSFFILNRHKEENRNAAEKSNSWTIITLNALIRTLQGTSIGELYSYFRRFASILFHYYGFYGIKKKYGLR